MLFIAWICNLRRFFNLIRPSTQHLFGSMYLRISKLVNMSSRNFLAWIILYLQGRYRCLNCCIFHRTFGISSLLLIFIMYEKSWDRSKVFRHLKLAIDDGNTLILLLLKFKYLRWIRFPIVVGNWPCVISNPLKSKTWSNLKFWKAGLSFSQVHEHIKGAWLWGAPLLMSLFRPGHLDHLAQVCNPFRSFFPDHDQFHLIPGKRRPFPPTGSDGKGGQTPETDRAIQSSLQDLQACVIIHIWYVNGWWDVF